MNSSRKELEKLRKRYEKNLAFFSRHIPYLYELSKMRGKKNVEIEVGPYGPNLRVEGQRVYPANRDAREIGRLQAENFLRKPSRILFPPPLLLRKTDRRSLNHETLNRIQDLASGATAPDFEHDHGFIPFLITFGLGLGYHLEALLRRTEVKYLVILEEDIELLKATFYTLNWRSLTEYFSRPGKDLFIFVHDDPEALYRDLEEVYGRTHPMFGVLSYVWSVVNNPLFNKVVERIKERMFIVLRGWGFFDDEFCSLVQTTANIIKRTPLFVPRVPVPAESSAIVVGAGPSLDERLGFLREEQERSVIISCGTAAATLEKAGVIPDFHVEIERSKSTYDVLVYGNSKEFLNRLSVVAANPDWHELFDLGQLSCMFLKANDAGAALFPDDYPWLFYCNPTVTNAGLALAVRAGFRRVGLVGVDLGTPDPERHHSLHTAYYDPSSPVKNFKAQMEKVITTPEGFKVYTNSLYLWTAATMEDLLRQHPEVEVLNLSLGLSIPGTRRITPDSWPKNSGRKGEALRVFSEKQIVREYPTQVLLRRIKELPAKARILADKTKRILSKDIIRSRLSLVRALCDLYRFVFFEVAQKERPLFLLYKGSFLHLSNHMFFLSYLVRDPEQRRQILSATREIWFNFLDRSLQHLERLRELVEEPEELLSLRPNENFLYYWF